MTVYNASSIPFTVPSTGVGCSFTVLNIARVTLELRSWRGLEFVFCALHGVATQVVVQRNVTATNRRV